MQARKTFDTAAAKAGKLRRAQAPKLAKAVSEAMQQLGMSGGRLEIELQAQEQPQSFGLESAELLVAGHAGATPRPLAQSRLGRRALAHRAGDCCVHRASADKPWRADPDL